MGKYNWRDSGKGVHQALHEAIAKAFDLTGVERSDFQAIKFVRDVNGKTQVVEWSGPDGAQVNVDYGHEFKGPEVPHVGWQTSGKGATRIRGHIFLDDVPYGRPR